MNYDIELTIRDRETKSIAVTIVPFEDDTIALYMNSTLISEPEEAIKELKENGITIIKD